MNYIERPLPKFPYGFLLIWKDGNGVLIETDITDGGNCTGTTLRGERCRLRTWPHKDYGDMIPIAVNGQSCIAIQPYTTEIANRFLAQRCKYHAEDTKPFCPPSWLPVQGWEVVRYPTR